MSTANDKQFGGDHYKGWEYEHWDFVSDLNLPYLIGCSSKYVSRWRSKNGLEDLKKADHYLEKAIERGDVNGPEPTDGNIRNLSRFIGQLQKQEAEAIYAMVLGNYLEARTLVADLITMAKAQGRPEAGPS